MQKLRNVYERIRESRIAITLIGAFVAVVLFVVLLSLSSHAPKSVTASRATTTTVRATTSTTAVGSVNTPGKTKTPPVTDEAITTFDTQIPPQTTGPNGEPPKPEGTKDVPLTPATATVVADVATKFTKAWAQQTLPKDQWVAGMEPYADGGFLATLADLGPFGYQMTDVTGPGVVTQATNPIQVQVPTSKGPLLVTVSSALIPSGMIRVLDIQPLSDSANFR